MTAKETRLYNVNIVLTTENGELPTDVEVQEMIGYQMAGVLDDDTGLRSTTTTVVYSMEVGLKT